MNLRADMESNGFAVIPNVIGKQEIAALIGAVEKADFARSTRGEETYGARNILAVPEIGHLANSQQLCSLVGEVIGLRHKPVRGIFFDKLPGANWPVAWHQDLSLAVSERHDVPGWGNWSVKAGVQHVQPPAEILQRMVTLRLQLDDSDAENGPLRVIPGSHKLGRLSVERLKSLRAEEPEAVCIAPVGSVLAMKPLILHASSAATNPKHRRVIHIEYAPEDLLPVPLEWAFSIN